MELAQKPIDLILLLDQSGSMKETDPQGNRVDASRAMVDFLVPLWTKEQNHRLGLVNFGDIRPSDPEDEYAPLASLDTAQTTEKEKLVSRIKPLDLRNTSFINGLRKARSILDQASEAGERQRVIMLLTDGEPDDLRPLTREQYFAEITRFYRESLPACRLYVFGIDEHDRFWSRNAPYWQRIARHIQRLTSANRDTLRQTFWSALSQEMGAVAEDWRPIPAEGLEVELDPYLEAVTFAFYKDQPGARVAITDPAGREVIAGRPGVRTTKSQVLEQWRIEEPEVGTWRCRLVEGTGRVDVGIMRIPVQPRLVYPGEVHPQGKPFAILASFLRKDGKPIKELAAYRLTMYASVSAPGQAGLRHCDLKPAGQPGLFCSAETISTSVPGDYVVTLSMKAERPVSDTTFSIKVGPVPYVEVLAPGYGESQPWYKRLRVEAQVRLAGEVVNPAEFFTSNPNAILFSQVFDDAGKPLRSGHLKFVGGEKDARFGADFAALHRNGQYRLVLAVDADGRDGRHYGYATRAVPWLFARRMGVLDFVIFRFHIILLVLLFAVLVWDWQRIGRENGSWSWRLNVPRLRGRLSVERSGVEVKTVRLRSRRQRVEGVEGFEILVLARRVREAGKRHLTDVPFVMVCEAGRSIRRSRQLLPDTREEVGGLVFSYSKSLAA